jgi:hypothetical protein
MTRPREDPKRDPARLRLAGRITFSSTKSAGGKMAPEIAVE